MKAIHWLATLVVACASDPEESPKQAEPRCALCDAKVYKCLSGATFEGSVLNIEAQTDAGCTGHYGAQGTEEPVTIQCDSSEFCTNSCSPMGALPDGGVSLALPMGTRTCLRLE